MGLFRTNRAVKLAQKAEERPAGVAATDGDELFEFLEDGSAKERRHASIAIWTVLTATTDDRSDGGIVPAAAAAAFVEDLGAKTQYRKSSVMASAVEGLDDSEGDVQNASLAVLAAGVPTRPKFLDDHWRKVDKLRRATDPQRRALAVRVLHDYVLYYPLSESTPALSGSNHNDIRHRFDGDVPRSESLAKKACVPAVVDAGLPADLISLVADADATGLRVDAARLLCVLADFGSVDAELDTTALSDVVSDESVDAVVAAQALRAISRLPSDALDGAEVAAVVTERGLLTADDEGAVDAALVALRSAGTASPRATEQVVGEIRDVLADASDVNAYVTGLRAARSLLDSRAEPFTTLRESAVAALDHELPRANREGAMFLRTLAETDADAVRPVESDLAEFVGDRRTYLSGEGDSTTHELAVTDAIRALEELESEVAVPALIEAKQRYGGTTETAAEEALFALSESKHVEFDIENTGDGTVVAGTEVSYTSVESETSVDKSTTVEDSVVNRSDIGGGDGTADSSGGKRNQYCPFCGADIDRPGDISFCPHCGEAL